MTNSKLKELVKLMIEGKFDEIICGESSDNDCKLFIETIKQTMSDDLCSFRKLTNMDLTLKVMDLWNELDKERLNIS